MFWGISFAGNAAAFWGPSVTVLALLVLIWSISKVRFIRKHDTDSSPDDSRPSFVFGRSYWIVVTLELLFLFAAVVFSIIAKRPDLIPIAFAVIIGLHFLPLAKIFKMPFFYTLGVAMVVIALVSLAIPDLGFRNLFTFSAIGLFMWVFKMPFFYILGLAMVVIAAISLVIPDSSFRNLFACSAIGLFMWVRAIVVIRRIASACAQNRSDIIQR